VTRTDEIGFPPVIIPDRPNVTEETVEALGV
jgi:hypothetical protein